VLAKWVKSLKAVFNRNDALLISITKATFLGQLLKDDHDEIWKNLDQIFQCEFRKNSRLICLEGYISFNK
jgi:hypothetical protein